MTTFTKYVQLADYRVQTDTESLSDHRVVIYEHQPQQHKMKFITYTTNDHEALKKELNDTELLLLPYSTKENTARNATCKTTWLSDAVHRHTIAKLIRTRTFWWTSQLETLRGKLNSRPGNRNMFHLHR